MKTILLVAISVFLLMGQATAAEQQKAKKDVKSEKEKLSYSLGYDYGSRMKKNSVDIDPNVFMKAFKEGIAGNKATMTDEEMRDSLQSFQKQFAAKQAEETKKSAEKNNRKVQPSWPRTPRNRAL